MYNTNIARISLSGCNNKCMHNELEKGSGVRLDRESPSALVSAPLFDGTNQATSRVLGMQDETFCPNNRRLLRIGML